MSVIVFTKLHKIICRLSNSQSNQGWMSSSPTKSGIHTIFFQDWLQFLLFPSLKYFQRICRELIDELFHHDYFPFHKFYMKYERLRCRYAKIFIIFVLFFVTIYSPPLKYSRYRLKISSIYCLKNIMLGFKNNKRKH